MKLFPALRIFCLLLRAQEYYIILELPDRTYKEVEMDADRWLLNVEFDKKQLADLVDQEALLEEAKMLLMKK